MGESEGQSLAGRQEWLGVAQHTPRESEEADCSVAQGKVDNFNLNFIDNGLVELEAHPISVYINERQDVLLSHHGVDSN